MIEPSIHKLNTLLQVRQAIYNEFGERIAADLGLDTKDGSSPLTHPHLRKQVRAAIIHRTYLGEEDPSQWEPDALVVILTEDYIPNPTYEGTEVIEGWNRIFDVLTEHGLVWNFGPNPAVMTVVSA
tara:strand:- start:193 stop:570 length:378 start_codon:yes stop_codon:yes gene_type:complete